MPPQLTPPTLLGKTTVPSRDGGVKMPSDSAPSSRAAHHFFILGHSAPGVLLYGESFRNERRRERGKRLREPRLFSRDRAARDGPLLDREQRNAGVPIEQKDPPHLRGDRDREQALSVATDRQEQRLSCDVVVPQVVVHDLEVPDHLARRGAQRTTEFAYELLPIRSAP
jgi:hypothetical protein